MKAPSLKSLITSFANLTEEKALLIRKLAHTVDNRDELCDLIHAHCPTTHEWRMRCYHDPMDQRFSRREIVMAACDEILGTHGIEALGSTESDPHFTPEYTYCNAGDPYVTTLLYKRDSDRILIGCWNDIAEQAES